MEDKMDDKKALSCLGMLSLAFVTTIIATVVGGLVIQIMWGWFITPLFGILPPTVVQAIGLSYFVSALSPIKVDTKSKTDNEGKSILGQAVTACLVAVFQPLFLLALGYVVSLFL